MVSLAGLVSVGSRTYASALFLATSLICFNDATGIQPCCRDFFLFPAIILTLHIERGRVKYSSQQGKELQHTRFAIPPEGGQTAGHLFHHRKSDGTEDPIWTVASYRLARRNTQPSLQSSGATHCALFCASGNRPTVQDC